MRRCKAVDSSLSTQPCSHLYAEHIDIVALHAELFSHTKIINFIVDIGRRGAGKRAIQRRRHMCGEVQYAPMLLVFIFVQCQLGSTASSPFRSDSEDEVYSISDDDVAYSSLSKLDGPLLGDEPTDYRAEGTSKDEDGQTLDGQLAGELTEADKKAMNRSHAAMLKIIALSWPSEGAFGEKVNKEFPPDQPLRFSWLRAQRKAFQLLLDSDMKSKVSGPSEEVLLALGYRYLHGVGTRRDCNQALECYNAVADSVARYMEENDSRETKLDLGLMRISLSEIDGILGEDMDAESMEFEMLSAQGGDTLAQKEVGWRSLVGRGMEVRIVLYCYTVILFHEFHFS